MFKNLKIGTRLGLGFGLLLALMLVSSAVGISQLGGRNASCASSNAIRARLTSRSRSSAVPDRLAPPAGNCDGGGRAADPQVRAHWQTDSAATSKAMAKVEPLLYTEAGRPSPS